MRTIFNFMQANKLTPNQGYLLYSIRDKIIPVDINVQQEIRALTPEWITTSSTLSLKSLEFLNQVDTLTLKPAKVKKTANIPYQVESEDFEEKVQEYRRIFPEGNLPSGVASRINVPELKKKFTSFFTLFPQYTWETVISATRNYVQKFEQKDYEYMKNSGFFISKMDVNRNFVYELASQCDMVGTTSSITEEYYSISTR